MNESELTLPDMQSSAGSSHIEDEVALRRHFISEAAVVTSTSDTELVVPLPAVSEGDTAQGGARDGCEG